MPVTSKLALQWLPCQAPGVIGSMLGLVSLVSVYCDWVRLKVWSATSISVWQHVKLSGQICPWDALACCWDVKQTTNNTFWHPKNKGFSWEGPVKFVTSPHSFFFLSFFFFFLLSRRSRHGYFCCNLTWLIYIKRCLKSVFMVICVAHSFRWIDV